MTALLKRHGRTVSYLLLTDFLLMVGTFGVALRFRHYLRGMDIINLSTGQLIPEAAFVFIYAFLMLGFFSAFGLYRRKVWLSTWWHTLKILQGSALVILLYVLLKALLKSPLFIPSRLVTLNWGILLTAGLLAHRLVVFPLLQKYASRTGLQRRVVLIGDSPMGADFLMRTQNGEDATVKVIGMLSDHQPARFVRDTPLLGEIAELPELVDLHKIEGAVITEPDLSHQHLMDLIEQCVRLFGWVDVHSEKSAVLHEKFNFNTYFDIPFVRLTGIPSNPLYFLSKRLIDIVLSLGGLIVLSPVMLTTALLIKITSPGPILYVRDRVGRNGKPFPFYKFRSMAVGADQDSERAERIRAYIQAEDETITSKVVNEAHITRVGRFIRRWAIDELPQLINVLKGDMSLVGPRPVPPQEFNLNEEWHKRRFDIKPGCTGLWKIYAVREQDTTFNNSVLYDIYYARNMNLLMDAYVILSTAWIVLRGRADG